MANAAPTGCYKCGRPGHWSRDCPSSNPPNPTNSGTNPGNPNNAGAATSSKQPYAFKTSGTNPNVANLKPVTEKPKKAPRTRPKLTPELLLSNDGLGYVLRHFPRNFKFRGHGHEVSDLGKLIGLYTEWHSRLLPYYSFDQFVKKTEQLGTTRRVKMTIRDLRERVANGGDLTKLHESAVEHDDIAQTQVDAPETMDTDELSHHEEHQSTNKYDTSDMHDDLLHEIYEKAVEGPSNSLQSGVVAAAADGSSEEQPEQINSLQNAMPSAAAAADGSSEEQPEPIKQNAMPSAAAAVADGISKEQPDQGVNKNTDSSSAFQMTEEQRARMEERRLQALEKAAARKRLTTAT